MNDPDGIFAAESPPANRPIVPPEITAAAAADQAAADRPADATAAIAAGRPAAAAAVIVDWNEEAGQFVEFAHALYVPLFPSLDQVYTAEVRGRIAGRLAPVMRKHDWNMARIFGRWGEEIMLAGVLVPLVPPTLAAIKRDREERAAAAADQPNDRSPTTAPTPPAEPHVRKMDRATDSEESPLGAFSHGLAA